MNTLCTYYFISLQSRSQDFERGGGFFGSLMQPKTNLTQIFISLKLDWGGFLSKLGDLRKKKEKKCLHRNSKGFSGRNQKFKVFPGRMQVISNKKRSSPKFKGFFRPKLEIQRVFLAEIRWSQKKKKKRKVFTNFEWAPEPKKSTILVQTTAISSQLRLPNLFGGAVFIFGAKIGLKSTKNVLFCIFFRPMGGSSSPHPPLATLLVDCR